MSAKPKEAKKRTSSSTASARKRAAIAELVKAARERGDDIAGPDGLLKSITATVLEAALEEEMADHLGHPKHPARGWAGNIRNGTRGKTVAAHRHDRRIAVRLIAARTSAPTGESGLSHSADLVRRFVGRRRGAASPDSGPNG